MELWSVDRSGNLVVNFHEGQARAWRSTKRFVIMIAGTQGGKTSFEPLWLKREMDREGPGDYLAVTATYELLKLKMLPEFIRYFEITLRWGRYMKSDRVLLSHEMYHGAPAYRIIFRSANKPESLESATAKAAVLDEMGQDQFRLQAWEAVMRRLALNQGRVLGGTTPYNQGWLKQQIYDKWLAGERDDTEIIQFDSATNPAFPREEMERARRELPDWKFKMFYGGLFTRPAGMIYEDFDEAYRDAGGHKVHAFDIPTQWPRYGGLDFGGTNTAKLAAALDPESQVVYLYREALSGGLSTTEHAKEAIGWGRGVNMVRWQGGAKSETQQRMDWKAAGLRVREPRVHDVESGINGVIELIKAHRFYVFDTCTALLDELGTYARVVDADGKTTDKIKDKETFHILDGLRYLVQGLPRLRGQRRDRTADDALGSRGARKMTQEPATRVRHGAVLVGGRGR